MVSVAMCTYNGAKFIREQLDSILGQTKPVDEIVVCDDGSQDETIAIIREYAQKQAKPIIRIYQNEKQLGCVKNFEKAINCCTGDIVFLSDQDDIWRKDKVKIMYDFFERNEHVTCVFTNGRLMGDDGTDLHETLWDIFGFDSISQQLFLDGYGPEVIARNNVATGATMAIRKTSSPVELPVTFYQSGTAMYHDEYLVLMATLENRAAFIVEPLISYRVHTGQTSHFDVHLHRKGDVFVPSKHQHAYDKYPLSDEQRRRMDFSLNRFNIARSVLGWRLWLNMVEYFVRYRGYAMLFFKADWKECWAYHVRKLNMFLGR